MRFLQVVAGVLVSAPALLFFSIGSQTFVRPSERALAMLLTIVTGAVLALSLALIVTPAVQRVQLALLALMVVLLAVTFALA